ncbi:MAG: CHASE domain-containing protein, partial [Thermoanaerobaculia bacterium]
MAVLGEVAGSLSRGLSAWRDAVRRRDIMIAVGAVALSVAGGALLASRDRALRQIDVGERARRLSAAVNAGLSRPLEALAALHSFFLADPNVTREKFRFFVQPLLRKNRLIYALEWMPIVPAAERDAYEAEARAAGLTGYRFWTLDERDRPVPIGPRPEYGPIHFMEPPNLDALGFDVEANPLRWKVAERACDQGEAAASRRFPLLEDAGKPDKKGVYSVAVYQPVFRSLEPPASKAGRRSELRGFLLAVFRVKPLVEAAIAPASTEGLRFALWDRTEEGKDPDLLFESEPGASEAIARLGPSSLHELETPLTFDRRWKLLVAAVRPGALAASVRGITVGLVGAFFAALAFAAVTALHAVVRLRRQVERVGPYTLVARLGRGAMGVVYEARHALLRRPTAIKLLAPGVAGERALARFEREVQLTAALTHPSTIAIYDYGRTETGVFYYAMELLRGVNLQHLVSIGGPVPPGRVVHLLDQACGALAEAHAAGLIHRDIKPANLMTCVVGGIPDFLKVLDFGLVKDLGAVEAPSSSALAPPQAPVAVSQDGSLLGTPLYLAPEGVTSPGSVDARLDIYALGAVAYFLLSGSPPFTGSTAIEIYARQRRGSPPPPAGPDGQSA